VRKNNIEEREREKSGRMEFVNVRMNTRVEERERERVGERCTER
jgi:hypothetical protein